MTYSMQSVSFPTPSILPVILKLSLANGANDSTVNAIVITIFFMSRLF